ncbi:MAG: hypothetical protein NTY15_21680, partial [Planctomycetota bacterium]|nr:hypothetical protein [Planctomycetota bacterium]
NSAATGAVTVSSGATLGGTGTIGGATTIAGIHNPGNSPGIQTFNSNLTYTSGASVNWELIGNTTTNTPNPNATFDSIVVGGNLDFGSSTRLNLNFGPTGTGSVLWADSFWDTSKTGTNGWLVYNVTVSDSPNPVMVSISIIRYPPFQNQARSCCFRVALLLLRLSYADASVTTHKLERNGNVCLLCPDFYLGAMG